METITQKDRLIQLVTYLMDENAQGETIEIAPLLPLSEQQLWQMFRGLINTRLPYPISEDFLKTQDDFLQTAHSQRKMVKLSQLEEVRPQISLWQGDITSLAVDAIVNAANSEFLGCFIPNHTCIDNEIQSKGGYQIRLDCYDIRQKQGRKEPIGKTQVTEGYNLPSDYILHTVAPITMGQSSPIKAQMLANCYSSVLTKADEMGLKSIALPCIGTGQFGYPQEEAADIAIETVTNYLEEKASDLQVIFNVFEDLDLEIYREKL